MFDLWFWFWYTLTWIIWACVEYAAWADQDEDNEIKPSEGMEKFEEEEEFEDMTWWDDLW